MEDGSPAGGEDDTGDGNSRRQVELDQEEDEEETKCKAAIEVEKRVYKGSFQVRARERGSYQPPSYQVGSRTMILLEAYLVSFSASWNLF